MKPTLLLLFCVLFYSCKKELTIEDKLSGKWELRSLVSGWTGRTSTYSPGNGDIREFTKTTYAEYSNGQLDESGTYAITKDTTMRGQLADRIIYNGIDRYPQLFISLEGDRLSFYPNMMDGGGSQYERIK